MASKEENGRKWSDAMIKFLLELYEEHLYFFETSSKTNKTIWEMIAKRINDMGHNVSAEDCDIKFRNLKKTYRRIKNNHKAGNGSIKWPYFSFFENFFGKDTGILYPSDILDVIEDKPGRPTNRKRPSSNSDTEPVWMKKFRAEAQNRHEEKMSLLKELVDMIKKDF